MNNAVSKRREACFSLAARPADFQAPYAVMRAGGLALARAGVRAVAERARQRAKEAPHKAAAGGGGRGYHPPPGLLQMRFSQSRY